MGMFQTVGSNERLSVIEGARKTTRAAAGSGQSDATTIGANLNVVTGASGTNGVILRKGKGTNGVYAGVIYSSAATNALLVYPPTGGTINGGSANAALSVTAQKPAIFYAITPVDFIINQSA